MSGMPGLTKEEKKARKEALDREVQEFLDVNRPTLNTVSGDSSIRYRPGNGFKIEFKEGVITLDRQDWEWKKKFGLDNDPIIWSTGHEIAHFLDLTEDPEGLLDNFRHMRDLARKVSVNVEQILLRRFGKLPGWMTKEFPVDTENPERGKMTGLQVFIYKRIHGFYNALDDIYVNKRVGMKLPKYYLGSKRGQQITTRLYRDFLFPTKEQGKPPEGDEYFDLQSAPRSVQLGDYLLRRRMVPEQGILIDDEVRQVVEREVAPGVTIERLIDRITDPSLPNAREPHIASYRHKQIRRYLEPAFVALLLKDAETMKMPDEPGKDGPPGGDDDDDDEDGGDGEGPIVEKEGKDKKDKKDKEGENKDDDKDDEEKKKGGKPEKSWNNPKKQKQSHDDMNEQTVEQYIKDKKDKAKEEKKKKKEEEKKKRMTPKQLADRAEKKADEDFAKQHDIPQEVMADYRALSREVEKYKEELARLFEKICQKISRQIEYAWEQYFRSGKLDVQRLARKYGHFFQEGALEFLPFDQLDAYEQRTFIEKLKLKPDEFRLRFVLDISGSMQGEKINKAKEIFVLFLESLATFEDKMARIFQEFNIQQPPIIVRTQIVVFGDPSDTREVKPLNLGRKVAPEQEKVGRIQGFAAISADSSATFSAAGWEIVRQTSAPEDAERIKRGELKDIAIEITDGGSHTPQEATDLLHHLQEKGLVCRGFQVGGQPDDKAVFDSIWGEDGEAVDDASALSAAVYKLLRAEIEKIEFSFDQVE